jgi:transposase
MAAPTRQLDVVLRQEHRVGEKTFVDYAGQTVPVTDPKTGEVRQAQVFVAVLGASNYTYMTWLFQGKPRRFAAADMARNVAQVSMEVNTVARTDQRSSPFASEV